MRNFSPIPLSKLLHYKSKFRLVAQICPNCKFDLSAICWALRFPKPSLATQKEKFFCGGICLFWWKKTELFSVSTHCLAFQELYCHFVVSDITTPISDTNYTINASPHSLYKHLENYYFVLIR